MPVGSRKIVCKLKFLRSFFLTFTVAFAEERKIISFKPSTIYNNFFISMSIFTVSEKKPPEKYFPEG